MDIALYRKYRPKSFFEVIGQDHVVKSLQGALELGKISHAYLFTGPRGTGKTTMARLLAKTVNCANQSFGDRVSPSASASFAKAATEAEAEAQGGSEPCNKCDSCQNFNDGRTLDLIEIDAASNRGIDEIRQLRDGIKYAPTIGKYKVFIIDEVHQLTKEAFNALLKTLEEPPAHAIFILATTEAHKVPETILSRVQQFAFRRLSVAEIIKKLQKIVEAEKIKIDEDAVRLIAAYAGGSYRDAESMLEQLRVWNDKIIVKEDIEELLGAVDFEKVKVMTDYLNNAGAKEAIDYVGTLTEGGTDLEMFAKTLINHLRKIMLIKVDSSLASLMAQELTPEQMEIVKKQADVFSLSDVAQAIKIFTIAQNDIKRSPIPSLPIELAVVEIINNKK